MPALTPSTFHWYEGLAPPFTGVAVKVTDDPGQNGFEDAVIETPAGKPLFTTILIWLLVAGLPVEQPILEVRTQVTASLFRGIYE